jgi:hypothetical protein
MNAARSGEHAAARPATMTEENARKIAAVLMTGAAVGVAYYVLKTPPLRRTAWRLAVTALTGTIPAWFAREVRDAWRESGRSAI